MKRAERATGIRDACSLEWHHSPLEDYLYGGLSTRFVARADDHLLI